MVQVHAAVPKPLPIPPFCASRDTTSPGVRRERAGAGGSMFKRLCVIAVLALSAAPGAHASSYLTDDPNEVFADVYARLGISLNQRIVRDPQIWVLLEELKREACDQKSILDLATILDKRGYRREAADGLYNFVRHCGAPHSALHRSIDIFLKLTDFPKAVEVADEYVRRAPTSSVAGLSARRGISGRRRLSPCRRRLCELDRTLREGQEGNRRTRFRANGRGLFQTGSALRGGGRDPDLDCVRAGQARYQRKPQDRRRLRAARKLFVLGPISQRSDMQLGGEPECRSG